MEVQSNHLQELGGEVQISLSGLTHISIPGEDLVDMGYAYAWWTKQIETTGKEIHWYSANGWGGQQIIVLPELNAVVVFTGGTYTHKVKEYEIIEDFILPALVYR